MTLLDLYADGASRSNPGPAGIGVVIYKKGEEIHTIYAFREANKIAQEVIKQDAVTVQGTHGLTQKYDGGLTRLSGNPCATVCSTVDTLWYIVEGAVNTNSMSTFTRTAPTGFTVPGLGPDQCKSDTVDILEAVGVNIAFGGNHVLWDTLNLLLTGAHLSGEEAETRYCLLYTSPSPRD